MAAPESERGLACLAYLFLWLTGLIILLTAKKEEKYKRWHAIQAIGLGIVVVIVYVVLNIIVSVAFATSSGAFAAGFGIMSIVNILVLVLVIIMMVQTYQGKTIRLPIVAGFADKNA